MALRSLRVPGVYRWPAPRKPEFPRLRSDVAGFVGIAGSARLHEAVRLDDWSDYELTFLRDDRGATVEPPAGSRLSHEVRAFFANGGSRCWVVNVAAAVITDPETGTAIEPERLIASLLGLPLVPDPVDADGKTLRAWGLELLLHQPEVAIVSIPDLFATRAHLQSRAVDRLPRRFEEGDFLPCSNRSDLEDIPPEQLPPELSRNLPILDTEQVRQAQQLFLERIDRAKWRVFALLAPPPDLDPDAVVAWRNRLGKRWDGAALYWPWVQVQEMPGDPVREEPPTGHVAGLFARKDLHLGPHHAPANGQLVGVVGTQTRVDDRIQSQVYARGVNVIRPLPGRGLQVWGARTLRFAGVEPPEDSTRELLGYINVRRCLSTIERSVERIGQSAAFEANTALLWLQLTQAVSGYLQGLFGDGVLLGAQPEQGYFVRCNHALNPPDQVALGRVRCEIGVAIGAPAEFIVFRLGRREGVVEIEEV